MLKDQLMVITGTSKGIGKYLAKYYVNKGFQVIGCSRNPIAYKAKHYHHFCLDIADEIAVKQMFSEVRKNYGHLEVLINNAGTASLNHVIITPIDTVHRVLNTNVVGTFLSCREASKIMKKGHGGRIVNVSSIAVPMRLEGYAIYAASKSAVVSFTQILARELGQFAITCNAVGPTPIDTDLIHDVSPDKITDIVNNLAVKRMGRFQDVTNVIDFFIKPESENVTGQTIYLGGV